MSRSFDILRKSENLPGSFAARPPLEKFARPENYSKARKTVIDEQILTLVQRVFVAGGAEKAPEAVAFSGVDPGAGCSWVCARVSERLAEQSAGNVCVVDSNLRTPALHEFFQVEKGAGFADAVRDNRPLREFARRVWGRNLWLISAGNVGREPNGALNPASLRKRFAELRAEFAHIVIDTPPASSYPDAVLLGQLTDGIILVVGSHSTRREPARIAKESFQAARIPILGAVLNKRTYPIPEALYNKL